MYSNYKFSYPAYAKHGSFDDFILNGMIRGEKFSELRQLVTNGSSLESVVNWYYNTTFTRGGALGSLFMHSLYLPSIAHYIAALGPQRVKVVRAEDLDVKDPERVVETLNDVFTFLGLCPVPITDLVPALPTRNTVPLKAKMSQDMYKKLRTFFAPFNDRLMVLTGVNLTHWNFKEPSRHLPKYSPSLNKSLPDLWFETYDSKAPRGDNFQGHVIKHLLPQQ